MIDSDFDPETYRPTLKEVADLMVTVMCITIEQLSVEDEIAERMMKRVGSALASRADALEPRYGAMVGLVGRTLLRTATDGIPGYDD